MRAKPSIVTLLAPISNAPFRIIDSATRVPQPVVPALAPKSVTALFTIGDSE